MKKLERLEKLKVSTAFNQFYDFFLSYIPPFLATALCFATIEMYFFEDYPNVIIYACHGLFVFAVWVNHVRRKSISNKMILKEVREVFFKPQMSTENPKGFIYLLRRQDGIYKIGRTRNLRQRIKQHQKDYGANFAIVKVWPTSEPLNLEKYALEKTAEFHYAESKRKELRKFNDIGLLNFLTIMENATNG